MRAHLLALFLFFAIGTVCAAQEKARSSDDEAFARCEKILKFGQLNDFFKPMKADAAVALGLLGDQRAVPLLLHHFDNEEDPNLHFQIARALGWLKSPKAVAPLEKMLKHTSPTHRNLATLALEEITGKDYGSKEQAAQVLPELEELLRGNTPAAKSFVEVGKSYRFVFTRSELKDVVAEVVELPRDGWTKLRNGKAESWVNLTAVTMILPVSE